MKRLAFSILLMASLPAFGQNMMRDALQQMPDSVIPYLSHSNRLDLLDYFDAKMKAEVTNELGGKSELLALTNDSLSIRLNMQHRIDAIFIDTEEPVDSAMRVIALGHTYYLTSGEYERKYDLFSLRWQPVEKAPKMSDLQRHRLSLFQGSTLLKRDDKVVLQYPAIQ
jgi:hypothetical protein